MAVNVRRLSRGYRAREEFLGIREARLAEVRGEVSPWGVIALLAIFGLGAFWVTGVLLWALIQFLPGLG